MTEHGVGKSDERQHGGQQAGRLGSQWPPGFSLEQGEIGRVSDTTRPQ